MIYGNKADTILNYTGDLINISELGSNVLLSENFVVNGFKTLGVLLKKLIINFFDMIEKLWDKFVERLNELCKRRNMINRNLNEVTQNYYDRGTITYVDPDKEYLIIKGNYMKEALDLKFDISIDIFQNHFMKLYLGYSKMLNGIKDPNLTVEERNTIFRKFHSTNWDEFGINDLLYPGQIHYDYDMINHFKDTFISGSKIFLDNIKKTTNIEEFLYVTKHYITFIPVDDFKLTYIDFKRNYSIEMIRDNVNTIAKELKKAKQNGMKCIGTMNKYISKMEKETKDALVHDDRDEFSSEYDTVLKNMENSYSNMILGYYRNHLTKYTEFCGNLLKTTSTLLGLAIGQYLRCNAAFIEI